MKPTLLNTSAAVALVSFSLLAGTPAARGQQSPPDAPTFRTTSNLVFLDVTVLDKKGQPVVKGLSRDDFTITEDKKAQKIFSFEAPDVHVLGRGAEAENPGGQAPVTVFVLDMLNSEFQDFAYIRYSVRNFLLAQPEQLAAPAEMMVVGNDSLSVLQGFTRSRADLLYALDHLPAALPYKRMNGAFFWERFAQSMDALQQIALQNEGIPGRKNVVWVGHGGPSVNLTAAGMTGREEDELKQYVHSTANRLVDARISLFVIYPGLSVTRPSFNISTGDANADIGETDPFAGDINFGLLVDETGGKLFFNRNDVDMLMKRSLRLGSEYYTLTYQPHDVPTDGKFRRIRVTLRDPNLHALTKAGYFAPEKTPPVDPRNQSLVSLMEAARSTIPLDALHVQIAGLVRHPDARTADVTLQLSEKNFSWMPTDDGKSRAGVLIAVASRDANQSVLASRMERLTITSADPDPARRSAQNPHWLITVPVPRKTSDVRVVIESESGGRLGSAVVSRKTIDAAPALPTPEPHLAPVPVDVGHPTMPPA